MRLNSVTGNTYRHRSWPLVNTSPADSSSRYLAGRISRPFSSRRGVWVPRNTRLTSPGPPHRFPSKPFLPHGPPLYSTLPHRQCHKAHEPTLLGGSYQVMAVEQNGENHLRRRSQRLTPWTNDRPRIE